jgi:hypothetical protein
MTIFTPVVFLRFIGLLIAILAALTGVGPIAAAAAEARSTLVIVIDRPTSGLHRAKTTWPGGKYEVVYRVTVGTTEYIGSTATRR